MRLIIAGGRDYSLSPVQLAALDAIHHDERITQVVSGGATGVDASGEAWARRNRIPVVVHKADWGKHGKAAGPRRNAEMAKVADAVALFKGGRGTASMFAEAERAGIRVYDFRGTDGN